MVQGLTEGAFTAFAAAGMFEAKALKPLQVCASAYLAFFVHWHLFMHRLLEQVLLLDKLTWQAPQTCKSVQVLPLAVAFVGYVVLWNVSLQLNSVGFYQLMKARPAAS